MKTLLLIDLSGIFWRCYHASKDQELSTAYENTVAKVRELRQGFDYVAVCCDSPPYERKKLHPGYKANREAAPPLALEQFRRTKERLGLDGLLLWEAPGFEADDVIAWAVEATTDRPAGEAYAITVASSDKDLLQLVSDEHAIVALNPFDGTKYDAAKVIEKLGVAPKAVADFLALTGDASDNVPGIKGIGPVNAAKLIAQFGGVEGIIAGAPSIEKPAMRDAILDGQDTIRLAKKLVTLRTDVPLDFGELFLERLAKPLNEERVDNIDEEDAKAKPSQALAKLEPAGAVVPFEHALEPGSIGGAYKLAVGMFNSRLYSRFPNAEALWAVMIRGREIGLGALTALDCFHVIEGKPAPHAHLIIARAKQHPDCEYFQMIESTAESATYETKNRRNPTPTRLTYTLQQAKDAGLVRAGGNWQKRPDEMVRKTAAVQLARIEYPDSALGLYAAEELE
jgi:5'-3' exonuclease